MEERGKKVDTYVHTQPMGYAVQHAWERRGEKRGDSRSPAQNQFNE
jgi:hypothetical protein